MRLYGLVAVIMAHVGHPGQVGELAPDRRRFAHLISGFAKRSTSGRPKFQAKQAPEVLHLTLQRTCRSPPIGSCIETPKGTPMEALIGSFPAFTRALSLGTQDST